MVSAALQEVQPGDAPRYSRDDELLGRALGACSALVFSELGLERFDPGREAAHLLLELVPWQEARHDALDAVVHPLLPLLESELGLVDEARLR